MKNLKQVIAILTGSGTPENAPFRLVSSLFTARTVVRTLRYYCGQKSETVTDISGIAKHE